MKNNNTLKCYNSLSCILSVLIIAFIVCSIGYDMVITKPEMRRNIEEIRTEVKDIHSKIDNQYIKDSLSRQDTTILSIEKTTNVEDQKK